MHVGFRPCSVFIAQHYRHFDHAIPGKTGKTSWCLNLSNKGPLGRGCPWKLRLSDLPVDRGVSNTPCVEAMFRHDSEHPADQMLRNHVMETHNVQMLDIDEAI